MLHFCFLSFFPYFCFVFFFHDSERGRNTHFCPGNVSNSFDNFCIGMLDHLCTELKIATFLLVLG